MLFAQDTSTPKSGITHVCLPNMGTACQLSYLKATDQGDRVAIKWEDLTCNWCRSLGRSWYHWACKVMQGHGNDQDRAALAGLS